MEWFNFRLNYTKTIPYINKKHNNIFDGSKVVSSEKKIHRMVKCPIQNNLLCDGPYKKKLRIQLLKYGKNIIKEPRVIF